MNFPVHREQEAQQSFTGSDGPGIRAAPREGKATTEEINRIFASLLQGGFPSATQTCRQTDPEVTEQAPASRTWSSPRVTAVPWRCPAAGTGTVGPGAGTAGAACSPAEREGAAGPSSQSLTAKALALEPANARINTALGKANVEF